MVVDVIVRPGEAFPPPGEIAFVDSISLQPGGNAVNTAIALGLLGHRALAVGRIGRDPWGTYLLNAMQAAGVDVRGVVQGEEPTAVTVAGVRPDGERSFLHVLGADAAFRTSDVPWDLVAGARIFHLTSVFVLPAFDGADGAQALRRAKEMGRITVLDVCWDAAGRWMDVLADYLPYADYFLPNLDEARALTGCRAPEEAADALLARGCGAVVIKLGRHGCLVASRAARRHVPAYPVQAVDSTGAGDVFGAAFMAALVRGWDPERAARLGNAAGAWWVSRPAGARLVPFADLAAWAEAQADAAAQGAPGGQEASAAGQGGMRAFRGDGSTCLDRD